MSSSPSIIDHLDAFIRKYYKNRLIKGLLYACALGLTLFIAVVTLEHFGHFSTTLRTILFYLFIAALAAIVGSYVVSPLLKMYKIGKRISYEDAARIIGSYFPEVSDKLLNLLQLQKLGNGAPSPAQALLLASIEQKTAQLRPIPFLNVINLKFNQRYIKYVAIPAGIILLVLLVSPSFITEPTKRIVDHNTYYERPAPFRFVIDNNTLEAAQQEDFLLTVSVEGSSVPSEAYVNVDGIAFKMQAVDKTHFSYLFKNLQHSHKCSVSGGGVESQPFTITVFPKPTIVDFQVLAAYPLYTGKQPETLSNQGDLVVPEGTVLKWNFQLKEVDTLFFAIDSAVSRFSPNSNGRLAVTQRVMKSFAYEFYANNAKVRTIDTLKYSITAIPDAAPMIAVIEMQDSTAPDKLFFQGHIKDDYGFSKLNFTIIKTNQQDTSSHTVEHYPIAVSRETTQEFSYSLNTNELSLAPGDRLQYYFEVWDNDGIHGPKSSKSLMFEFSIPSEEELDNILDRNSQEAQQKAVASQSELKKLQDDINELMRKLVDKKELSWQDKKDLKELSDKQKQLKSMLDKMQSQIQENNRLEQKYREQNEEIMEKQRELDRLFNEVMNDEMKKTLEEMDKLMQEMDKKQVQEQLENIKMNNEELSKQLDQNLELMKRLELEKKVDQAVQKASELAKKQEQLSKETQEAKGKNLENLESKQQQLSEQFKDLKNDIQQIKNDYKSLDPKADFKTDKELENKIQQQQQESSSQLQKGNKKSASDAQKQAADDLEKLSQQLAEEQEQMEQEDMAEDAEAIRRLLKNLVSLSFSQEGLIEKVNKTYIQDPQYQTIILKQNKIKEDFRSVEDSLRSIAKRQITVASAINQELGAVNSNIGKSLSGLLTYNQSFYGSSRNTATARSMQYSMTSLNNLALLLAESLDKMQNQQRQKSNGNCKNKSPNKKSNSQCNNPGKNPSPKSMRQMQEELNKQMEALKKQLDKEGKQPGRKKIGDGNTMSQEFAKMAAQQEMIRRMMQQYGQEMKQQSGGDPQLAKEIDQLQRQMEQTETDLVNKTITQQTIRRQQQIMTRLLEHEKAEMQREKEQRRESHEAVDQYHPSPADMEKYNQMKEKNVDLFRHSAPNLNNFYKDKVNNYFYQF